MAYNPQNPNGQATMANSAPVAIASNQSAIPITDNSGSITVDGSVSVSNFPATQPVSGTVTANISGSISNTSFAVTQATAANLKAQTETFQGGSAVSSSNPLNVTLISTASGGDTVFQLVTAASNNAQVIKNSTTEVVGWYIYNSNTSARKVVLYNTNSTPNPASTTPVVTLVIPGLAAANVSIPSGLAFSTGLAIATVTGLANNDNTAVALNDLVINIFYK